MDKTLESFITYLNNLDLEIYEKKQEFGYDSPVLICIDAVLSINRQYKRFVVPRIENFKKNYPDIKSLLELNLLLEEKGIVGFRVVWNYNHPKRALILKDLVEFFLEPPVNGDLKKMCNWAQKFDVFQKGSIPVKGIGFATTQYIRKMLGVDTVKPDVHLKRSVELGIGTKLSDKQTVRIFEQAAKEMNVLATELDNAVWRHFSYK